MKTMKTLIPIDILHTIFDKLIMNRRNIYEIKHNIRCG